VVSRTLCSGEKTQPGHETEVLNSRWEHAFSHWEQASIGFQWEHGNMGTKLRLGTLRDSGYNIFALGSLGDTPFSGTVGNSWELVHVLDLLSSVH